VLTVADLLCGCGGFSYGFDYAGFEIVYGLDNWDVACESFRQNFPKAEVVCQDALTLSADDIPSTDIIIGGPPCQQFSVANLKKSMDSSLIEWFLKVVMEKEPEYWIMENVPLAKKVVLEIAKKLEIEIPKMVIYRMHEYGVPQIRKRLFCGRFPEPIKHPINVVFPTVLATEWKGSAGKRQMKRLSWAFNRKSLLPEAKLVQTFPLDFYLAGTLREQYIQIGNAVPPLMAYRLAEAIIDAEQNGVCTLFLE